MNFLSLSTIFTNLTKSFSAGFWLAGVFPSAVFFLANAAMLYILSGKFRAGADVLWKEATVGRAAFLSAFGSIAVLLFAYSVTALSTRLRKTLEGDWPAIFRSLRDRCIEIQGDRRRSLQDQIRKIYLDRRVELDQSDWKEELIDARQMGTRMCKATAWARPANDAGLEAIRNLLRRNQIIPANDLESRVRRLQQQLLTHDADASPDLDAAHEEILGLISYAVDRAQEEHFQLFNRRQFSYGSTLVAPTEMGNIAGSVQAYAVTRYNFNLELFWSSLQKCTQKDKDFSVVIDDAKTRLDFLIASFWFTVLFWVSWSLILPIAGFHFLLFLLVAGPGPIVAFGWYRAATEQYRAFADAIKTTIDMFRFDLLDGLRLRRPEDLRDEQDMWKFLNGVIEYGEEGNFRYEFPPRA